MWAKLEKRKVVGRGEEGGDPIVEFREQKKKRGSKKEKGHIDMQWGVEGGGVGPRYKIIMGTRPREYVGSWSRKKKRVETEADENKKR